MRHAYLSRRAPPARDDLPSDGRQRRERKSPLCNFTKRLVCEWCLVESLSPCLTEDLQMKVGGALFFQTPHNVRSDRDVYTEDLRIGALYEPLGFDSIWSVEHHFDDYTMCPDVLQFLTYFAGRTKTIQLGSMVVVMPWHDPMRVAEQVSV